MCSLTIFLGYKMSHIKFDIFDKKVLMIKSYKATQRNVPFTITNYLCIKKMMAFIFPHLSEKEPSATTPVLQSTPSYLGAGLPWLEWAELASDSSPSLSLTPSSSSSNSSSATPPSIPQFPVSSPTTSLATISMSPF